MFAYKNKLIKKENIKIIDHMDRLNFIYTSEKHDFKLIINHMRMNSKYKVYSLSLGDFISKKNFPFSSRIFRDLGLTKSILEGFEVQDVQENKKISEYAKIFLNNLLPTTEEAIEYDFDFSIRFQNKENNLSHEYRILLFFKLLNRLLEDNKKELEAPILLFINDFELFQNHSLSDEIKKELLLLKKYSFLTILINVKSSSTLLISEKDYWNFYKSYRNKHNEVVIHSFKKDLEKINKSKINYRKAIFFLLSFYNINFMSPKKIIFVTDKRTKYLIDTKFNHNISTYYIDEINELNELFKYFIKLNFNYKMRVVFSKKDLKKDKYEEFVSLLNKNNIEYTKFTPSIKLSQLFALESKFSLESLEIEKVKTLYSFIESTVPNFFLNKKDKTKKDKKEEFFASLEKLDFDEAIEETIIDIASGIKEQDSFDLTEEAIIQEVNKSISSDEKKSKNKIAKKYDAAKENIKSKISKTYDHTKTAVKEKVSKTYNHTKTTVKEKASKTFNYSKEETIKKLREVMEKIITESIKFKNKIKPIEVKENAKINFLEDKNLNLYEINFLTIDQNEATIEIKFNVKDIVDSVDNFEKQNIKVVEEIIETPSIETIEINNPLEETTIEILQEDLVDHSIATNNPKIFDIEEIINNQINKLSTVQTIELQRLIELKLLDGILTTRINKFLSDNKDKTITKKQMSNEILHILINITSNKNNKKSVVKEKKPKHKKKNRTWNK